MQLMSNHWPASPHQSTPATVQSSSPHQSFGSSPPQPSYVELQPFSHTKSPSFLASLYPIHAYASSSPSLKNCSVSHSASSSRTHASVPPAGPHTDFWHSSNVRVRSVWRKHRSPLGPRTHSDDGHVMCWAEARPSRASTRTSSMTTDTEKNSLRK